jgi:hypothetical protein
VHFFINGQGRYFNSERRAGAGLAALRENLWLYCGVCEARNRDECVFVENIINKYSEKSEVNNACALSMRLASQKAPVHRMFTAHRFLGLK